MDAYINGNTVNLSVTNLKEFQELMKLAQKQADELQQTLRRLETYNLRFDIKVD